MARGSISHIYIALAVVGLLALTSMLAVHTLIEDTRQFHHTKPNFDTPFMEKPAFALGSDAAAAAGAPCRQATVGGESVVAGERVEAPTELMEVWRPSSTAVVVPFIRCQVESRIYQNLARWKEHPPCDVAREEAQPSALGNLTLVFHYNRDAEAEPGRLQSGKMLLEGLNDLWDGLGPLQRCFRGGMRVLSSKLTDTQDQYPLGPCVQFYNAFSRLEDMGFDHWFQMEPDVTPIQAFWGVELLRYAATNPHCRYWWQSGSNALYKNEVDFSENLDRYLDMHLNGNAMYCLASPAYADFRERVQRFYPPGGCWVPPHGMLDGFDHAMYRFRIAKENRQYMNGLFSRFRVVDLILNYGIEAYDPAEVLGRQPAAFFVHSRVPFGVRGELARRKEDVAKLTDTVRTAFYSELGRLPAEEETAPFLKAIWDGRLTTVSLVSCVLRQLLRLASLSIPGLTFEVPSVEQEEDSACRQDLVSAVFSSKEFAGIFIVFLLVHQVAPNLKELSGLNHPGLPLSEEEAVVGLRSGSLSLSRFAERLCALNRFPVGKTTGLQSICLSVYILTGSFKDSCGKDLKYDPQQDTLTGTCNNAEGGTTFSELRQVGFACQTPPGNGDGKLFCDRVGNFEDVPSEEKMGRLSGSQAGYARSYRRVFANTDLSGRELVPAQQPAALPKPGQYRVWCADFHAAPIGCNIPLFEDIGVSVEARIDYGNCKHHHTKLGDDLCSEKGKKEIKVLRFDNKRGYGLDPCPSLLREQFFEAYSDSFDLNSMDFFICSHPVANCELYIPFGRPIIIYATTRLEFGRHDQNIDWRSQDLSEESPKRFQEWVRNLQALAKDPRNIVAANNAYDAAYIEYFTGIKALYIPSWCGGDASSPELIGAYAYQPKRMRVLIIPYRTNLEFYPEDIPSHGWPDHSKRNSQTPYGHPILKELADVMRGGSAPEGLVFASIHWEYGHEFSSPAVFKDHPAVVFLPYQFSTMSFFEAYRQSVPMLVPSRELLLKWVSKYGLMWERVYGDPARPRDLPRSPLPNPNSFDSATVAAWLDTHDFFQGDRFPHLLHFSSWEHAIQLLQSTDLAQVGLQMHLHNQREYVRQRHEWQQALVKARAWADASRGAGRRPGVLDRGHQSPANVSFALHSLYGLPPLPPDPKPGCAALREEWERGGAPKVKRKKGPDKCHA